MTSRLFDPILAAKASIARMTWREPGGMNAVDLSNFPAVGVPAELVGLCVAISAPAIKRFAHFADLLGASFGKLKRG